MDFLSIPTVIEIISFSFSAELSDTSLPEINPTNGSRVQLNDTFPTTTPQPPQILTTTVEPVNWENEVDGSSQNNGNRSVLSDEVADAVKFYLYKRVRLDSVTADETSRADYLQPLIRQGKSIRSDNEPLFASRVIPSEELDKEFDPNLKTKILIHGWLNSKDTDNFQIMKENYLRKQDLNVLVVDWSKLSYGFNYLRAAGKYNFVFYCPFVF